MQEIGTKTRFFATRSLAHFKGRPKSNKVTIGGCSGVTFKEYPTG